MAIAYISALWGNDSNDGLSLANAKATISAGLSVIANGGSIHIYPGIYNEIIQKNASNISVLGIGKVIIDGENMLANCMYFSNRGYNVENLEIKNFTGAAMVVGENRVFKRGQYNNIIHNCQYGIYVSSSLDSALAAGKNTIYDCENAFRIDANTGTGVGINLINNTVFNCDIGIYFMLNSVDDNTILLHNNIISNCDKLILDNDNVADLSTLFNSNGNIFDVRAGQLLFENNNQSITATGLSDWQNETGQDDRSQEANPSFVSEELGIFSLQVGSIAASGALDGGNSGAHFTEVGWSNFTKLTSGAEFDGTEIIQNSSPGIQLESTETTGTVVLPVIDLGFQSDIDAIRDLFTEQFNNKIIDDDVSDNSSTDGKLNIEFKVSPTQSGLEAASFELHNLRDTIDDGLTRARFIQAKLTLNR